MLLPMKMADTSYLTNVRGAERLVECWRKPSLPFRAPVCCGRTRRIGWNVYRC